MKSALLSIAVVVLIPAVALCQTDAEVNAGIQFNFFPPGARSLAMGGAFISLADDATTAYSNPAGLTLLSKQEISLELRGQRFSTSFVDRGHIPLPGQTPHLEGRFDDTPGVITNTSSADTTGVAFFSYVYPSDGWTVAAYRHQFANYAADFRTQGIYLDYPGSDGQVEVGRYFPTDNHMRLNITNYGLSVARKYDDRLSFGLGLSEYRAEMRSTTGRYGVDDRSTTSDSFLGAPRFESQFLNNSQTQTVGDSDLAMNLGFLFRWRPNVTFGGVFRQGPSFHVDGLFLPGPASAASDSKQITSRFRVPDSFGGGVTYRPADVLTITAELLRVRYSQLARASEAFFRSGDLPPLTSKDATEIHVGTEYVIFTRLAPLFFRAGMWRDPEHRFQATDPTADVAPLFRKGSDVMHYSAGIGLVLRRSLQLDSAFDYSTASKTLSLSMVTRF